jgi:Mrp family chromosome partitioning ATPase
VLLIDADMRRPALSTAFDTASSPGLAEFLAGEAKIGEIMQRSRPPVRPGVSQAPPNLFFIPAGNGGDHSSELAANNRMEALIEAIAPSFKWILIDSPPVLAFSDAVDLARAADGVLLVARGDSTPYDVAQRAQVAFSNAHILGFVLNAVKDPPNIGSYYYYGKNKDEKK